MEARFHYWIIYKKGCCDFLSLNSDFFHTNASYKVRIARYKVRIARYKCTSLTISSQNCTDINSQLWVIKSELRDKKSQLPFKCFYSVPEMDFHILQNCFASQSNTAVFSFWMNPRFERIMWTNDSKLQSQRELFTSFLNESTVCTNQINE